MTRFQCTAIACCAFAAAAAADFDPADPVYLPAGLAYDEAVPTPERHLGFRIGSRHLRHHELAAYARALANASDRVVLREYARTYGGRPLLALVITDPANHGRLDGILATRRAMLAGATVAADTPVVMNMGYGVHGDEPSASNVAPLVAYHLAAAQSDEVAALLRKTVVVLDPCLNPDGFDRFAAWANAAVGRMPNPDPNAREHNQPFARGRTNFYWFDLNRDWLPARHPESVGRLALFREFLPDVQLDFHEMGTDSSYFFQPGIPARDNPLTPAGVFELTAALAAYHAKALDRAGVPYFSRERFDDFYPGKGSTYPDLNGGVGVLFEQASARGLVQAKSDGSLLTFPETVRNQMLTSLSSLAAVGDLHDRLLAHKSDFFRTAADASGPADGYVVHVPRDRGRMEEMRQTLDRHGIAVHRLAKDFAAGDVTSAPDPDTQGGAAFACLGTPPTFPAGDSFVVPTDQPQGRLVRSLFGRRTGFAEPIFYDVSAWTLPLAFDMPYTGFSGGVKTLTGERITDPLPAGELFEPGERAYLIDWADRLAPRCLHALLAAGVRVRVATESVAGWDDALAVEDGFGPPAERQGFGTLLVNVAVQPDKRAAVERVLAAAVADDHVSVRGIDTFTGDGFRDLGSDSYRPVERPKVLLVTGAGVSAYEAGEMWHLFDQVHRMPVTLVDAGRLDRIDLDDYTTVVMASGTYDALTAGVPPLPTAKKDEEPALPPVASSAKNMHRWLAGGGTLLATGSAAKVVRRLGLADVAFTEPADEQDRRGLSVGDTPKDRLDRERQHGSIGDRRGRQLVSGAILNTRVDLTHPLGYGLTDSFLPVIKTNRIALGKPAETELRDDDFRLGPAHYGGSTHSTDGAGKLPAPLVLAGYVSPENLGDWLKPGRPSVTVTPAGQGRVIALAENPVFRAYFLGSSRLVANAVFFGSLLSNGNDGY